MNSFDVIIVGSGLAGLYGALLAAQYGDVLVITKARLRDSNTFYAQGGIAAALAATDSPDLHFQDTMAAGAGLCDPRAVRTLVEEGPRRVRDLIDRGVHFDRVDGKIAFTREGAHSRARVLHAGGDATGARIETTIAEQVAASPRVTILENHLAFDLVRDGQRVTGVQALDCATGTARTFHAGAVVLATGGAGRLFSQTTNPPVATGDGLALAFRAGAQLADLEFVQFHPTALAVPEAPRFLISEAVRGEGGILRNARGERFMARYDPRLELAPRDVVARAIAAEAMESDQPCVYLDVTHLGAAHFRQRFPTIAQVCEEFGIDVGRDYIPVAPAAHYLMGGVWTNLWGETSLPGLYACGECACTGVHGANRLASNSLLETIVFSARIVQRLFAPRSAPSREPIADAVALGPDRRVIVDPARPEPAPARSTDRLRELTWALAGLSRDAAGLARLARIATAWEAEPLEPTSRSAIELSNLTLLARLLAIAALERTESRGAHYRTDFPVQDPSWQRRIVLIAKHSTGEDRDRQRRASTIRH